MAIINIKKLYIIEKEKRNTRYGGKKRISKESRRELFNQACTLRKALEKQYVKRVITNNSPEKNSTLYSIKSLPFRARKILG